MIIDDAGPNLILRRCGALIYPKSWLIEGNYHIGKGDYTVYHNGITTGVRADIGPRSRNIDCNGRVALVGAPLTLLLRRAYNGIKPYMRSLMTRLPYYKLNLVETKIHGKVRSVYLSSDKVQKNISETLVKKSIVLEEHYILQLIEKGTGIERIYEENEITLLIGMNKKSVFGSIEKLGRPLLTKFFDMLGNEAKDIKITVITNGWLTSSDLEILKDNSNARIVFCAMDSLNRGLGAWLPIHELMNSELGKRLTISFCEARGHRWWEHPIAITTIVSMVTKYYSWKKDIDYTRILELIYKDPYIDEKAATTVYLYNYRPSTEIKTIEQLSPLLTSPSAIFIVRRPPS